MGHTKSVSTKPILFSAPMIRALLDGRKTQTRRILKAPFKGHELVNLREHENDARFSGQHNDPFSWGYPYADDGAPMVLGQWPELCPYGKPGDLLWVRETTAIERQVEGDQMPPFNDGRPVKRDEDLGWRQPHYRATDPTPELEYEESNHEGPTVIWKPSIHMPRWASRLTLRITDVRVQRLQDISEADAIAEGATSKPDDSRFAHMNRSIWSMDWPPERPERGWCDVSLGSAGFAFAAYINQLHGGEHWNLQPSNLWNENPWIWAVTFEVIKQNVDDVLQVTA